MAPERDPGERALTHNRLEQKLDAFAGHGDADGAAAIAFSESVQAPPWQLRRSVLPTNSAVGPAAKEPVSLCVRKGRDVEPLVGKVAKIVTTPFGTEVGAASSTKD
ncbi:hypothetical protein GCM10012319_74020 [Comamonas sp. KCTC 72670]|nr:hypothetical protein GCM10012319_74020 [Comamonas sp. KCTC 72670]